MWREAVIVPVLVWSLGSPEARAQEVDLSQLKIVEGQAGLDQETGFIHIAGEVHNRSSEWVLRARLTVELLDASGRPIRVDSISSAVAEEQGGEPQEFIYTERTYIPPGEVGVFHYVRDAKKLGRARYASHRLTVASARRAVNPPQVVIDDLQMPLEDGVYTVSGRIRNRGQVGCFSPKVVIGVYGTDGKIFKEERAAPDQTSQKVLGGGQAVQFRTKVYMHSGETIGSLKAWADCDEPY